MIVMLFRVTLAFCLGGCLIAGAAARAENPPAAVLHALSAAGIPENAVALEVRILDPSDPAPLRARHNADAAMNPASVMKLLTTYAALEILGPESVWQTGVWADHPPDPEGRLQGNLYLKGSGDPKLTLESFWLLLRQLRARGVRRIEGDLVLDRSVFAAHPDDHDPEAFDGYRFRAYNVGPDALLLDFRALRLTLLPVPVSETAGNTFSSIGFRQNTPAAGLTLQVRLHPDKSVCSGWRDRLGVAYAPRFYEDGSDLLDIQGAYPIACGEQTLNLSPWLSADRHVEGLFRALWQEQGGALQGAVRPGNLPDGAVQLARHVSPPVAEVIRDINKWSSNVMARQIFLALGDTPPKTEIKARARIAAWLAQKGLSFPELFVENGAGLSRKARVSAASLIRLLEAAWQSPLMPEFIASLPVAGVDGTLKTRLRQTSAQGRAHLKTGTLDGVKTIAGYVQDIHGRRYALAFLINHPRAEAGVAAMDTLIQWTAEGCPPDR